jgi:hypothetical protein
MNPAPEHCWKHCLGLEHSDGVLNMVEDKVEGRDPFHVPDGEGGTLLYQQVNNLHSSQVTLASLKIYISKPFKHFTLFTVYF